MPKRNPADAEAFTVLHTKVGAVNSVHEGDIVRPGDLPGDIQHLLRVGAIRSATAEELDTLEEREKAREKAGTEDLEDQIEERFDQELTDGDGVADRGRKVEQARVEMPGEQDILTEVPAKGAKGAK